jgi:hypothetical protein
MVALDSLCEDPITSDLQGFLLTLRLEYWEVCSQSPQHQAASLWGLYTCSSKVSLRCQVILKNTLCYHGCVSLGGCAVLHEATRHPIQPTNRLPAQSRARYASRGSARLVVFMCKSQAQSMENHDKTRLSSRLLHQFWHTLSLVHPSSWRNSSSVQ